MSEEPKSKAEIIAAGLDRARAEERYEREENEKFLNTVHKVDTDNPNVISNGQRWQTGKERIEAFGDAIRAAKGKLKKPETHECGTYSHTESIGTVTPKGLKIQHLTEAIDPKELYEFKERQRFKDARHARDCYLRRLEDETGEVGDEEFLKKEETARADLRSQSHDIALTLENAGIAAYRRTQYSVYSYYVHSGIVLEAPKFRRLCFLPYIASELRSPYVKAMEYHLQEDPWCRMWTFTSGKRISNDSYTYMEDGIEKTGWTLRDRLQEFHRDLSKLNHWLRKRYGIRILFRATEFGTPERYGKNGKERKDSGTLPRDDSGSVTYHVHSHCLVKLPKRFPPEVWSRILSEVGKKWPHNWDESKRVLNPREICKYVTKPSAITQLKPQEIVDLYHSTRRIKLMQPMADLAAEMKRRKAEKMVLRKRSTPDGKVWIEEPDHNRKGFVGKPPEPKKGEKPSKEYVEWIQKQNHEKERKEALKGECEGTLKVVSKCVPGYAPGSCVKEPRIIVVGTHWDQRQIDCNPIVQRLIAVTRDLWQAGQQLAASIRVHTGRTTVLPGQAHIIDDSRFNVDESPPITESFEWYQKLETC